MKEISLTQGKVALVDDDMFDELNKYKWFAHKRVSIFYAARCLPREGKKQRTVSMHQMIMGKLPDGHEIDHKDGNGLNNQRDNLRFVTHRQNGQNRHQIKASKYPGLYFHKKAGKWCSRISLNGKRKNLGYFLTEEEAFQAYRNAANNIGESVIRGIFKDIYYQGEETETKGETKMKKLKVFLIVLILMAFMPSQVFAAVGTITGTIERILTAKSKPLVIITLTCTAGAAGGDPGDHLYPATVINTLSGIADFDLRGLKLYSIVTVPGTTGPTDNSDLTITDRYGIDMLAGAGTNIVDNATSNRVVVNPDTAAVIITGNLTVNITNNIVDSAVVTLVLELVGI